METNAANGAMPCKEIAVPVGKKRRTTPKFGMKFLTFLLCILFSVSLLGSTIFGVVHSVFSKAYIEETIAQLDLYQILRGVTDSEELIDTLAAVIQTGEVDREQAAEEILETLINSHEMKAFLSDKIGDYMDDLRTGSGAGEITVEDIVGLVRSLEEPLGEAFGRSFSEEDYEELKAMLSTVDLEMYSLSRLREGNEQLFDALKLVLSSGLLLAVLGWTAFLLALIILINIRYFAYALRAVGITSLVTSGPIFALQFGFGMVINMIKEQAPKVFELVGVLLDKLLAVIATFAGCLAGAGLLLLIIGIVLGIVMKKRRSEEPAAR